jgi:hypothetical protein
MTAPLVPPDIDLRNFDFVPIFRRRLFASKFHLLASGEEWRAGFILWLKSWDESPAGSLPNNDRELCALAELPRDMRQWRKVKKWALHGWELCEDGRLYHPVVAEVAVDAWQRIEANRHRTSAATEARQRHRNVNRDDQRNVAPLRPTRSPPKSPPRNGGGDLLSDLNGKGEPATKIARPINPKILGHALPCHCENCLRWAALHPARRAQALRT